MTRLLGGLAILVFAASSVWLSLLMPRTGFSTPPPGFIVSRDELLAQVDRGQVASIFLTGDQYDDIVARTASGGLLVYRVTTSQGGSSASDAGRFIQDVQVRGREDLITHGKGDSRLAAYAGSLAQLPPPDPAIPALAWFVSLIVGLSIVMYTAAGRTDFRFSVPFGLHVGVGTNRSPQD